MSRVFIGQFKGAKGETGDQGIKGDKGEKGDKGDRGSRITRGTAITGTSTNGTKFPNSGISDAKNHDYYINENTGNLYECIVPGNADTAEWAHAGSFKGPKGDTGPAGSISNINEQKPTYTEAAVLTNISSGETVKIAFGKLKKALSVLMTHYVQQATASVLGHVKLSNSAAVTQTGQMALDAVEKNASVAGTLANQISQVNSNMDAKADKDKWAQGTITERGVTVLFKISYHSAWLLVGWVLAGGGAATPTVCIAVDGAAGDSCNVSTIFSGTSVTFALAEDRKTIQFNNPYGNVCFWHAMRV